MVPIASGSRQGYIYWFFWLLLLGVLLLVQAESVSSVVSSLPVLPYFCPEGRRRKYRERIREPEYPWKPNSDE